MQLLWQLDGLLGRIVWELICHHDYRWGAIAADRSPWRSDGLCQDVTPLPGGSGLLFSTPRSRIAIPRRNGDPWRSMHAIHVEVVASALQGGGTVIDADQCFRLRFDGPRKVVVELLGYTLEVALGDDLPLGNWVTFQFSHNGVNQLSYNYHYSYALGLGGGEGMGTGSPHIVPGQVPPVGPEGVWIGSQIGNPARHLNGGISSVKIRRFDPRTQIKTFLRRPFTPTQLDCWVKFVRRFNDAAEQYPECAAWLVDMLGGLQSDFLAKLAQQSPEEIAEFWTMCEAYQKLWAGGKVGSPEMSELVTRLRDWLRDRHLFSGDDPDIQPLFQNPCLARLTGIIGGLECDTDVQTLLTAILGARDGQAAIG